MRILPAVLLLLAVSCASTGERQDVHVAPNAPQDRPVAFTGAEPGEALKKWLTLVGPHVQKARATYPAAKRRYLAGLPPRQTFFVTTLLRDQRGRFENVFVVVDQIASEDVTGRIASHIDLVQGYRAGQRIRFPESDVIDWMISKPDGSEEGNFVGKFLDTVPRTN